MRKLLLVFVSMMAFIGMSVAQDVYSVGYYTPSGASYTKAALYKNGSKIQEYGPNSDFNFKSTSVDFYNGDAYWTTNATRIDNNEPTRGMVKKNGTTYLDTGNGVDNGAIVNKVTVRRDGNHTVATVGSKLYDGVRKAVLWTGTSAEPQRVYGADTYNSEAISGMWVEGDGNMYACGYQYTSSSTYHGVIWHASEIAYSFPNGTKIIDMAYHDGSIYSVGIAVENGQTKLKVWTGSTEKYTLSTNTQDPSTYRYSIYVEAGDVYVNGQDGSPDKIWKNGVQIYSTDQYFTSVVVNTNGIYYAGSSSGGKIWKDGSVLYSLNNCDRVMDMHIEEPACANTDILSLPFTEGFENGETNWACWTKIDVDNNNAGHISYWTRGGEHPFNNTFNPATGDYCAYHRYGDASQEGWLISPQLFLQPGRDNTTLSFKSCLPRSTYYYPGGCSVWISTTNNSTNSFTKIWEENNPSASWSTKNVDLAPYQGMAVYIAFKFTNVPSGGGNNHCWLIDDVNVQEEWQACSATSVPYSYNFENWDLNSTCWYVVDYDKSGDNKHWKYDADEQCAYHPWGQNGVEQYGCLVSPNINLPAGHDYVLKFKTKNSSSGSNMSNKIWIKLDGSGIPNPDTYTTMIWDDNNFPNSWTEVEVPLSNYAGHVISFSFEYQGTYAHKWYIDDVRVEESIAQYTITANANNNAWGSVTGGGTYNAGATCTLTATPASGYQFESWKKNGSVVSTNPNYSFTVSENATYTAYFAETPVTYYTITTNVTPAGAGTVMGAGTYPEGSTVTLTASANDGYEFSQWNDGNTQNPRTITVTGNATYTASFNQLTYTINVYANPTTGGTVYGGGAYHYGETITIGATPNNGYEFQGWSDGNSNNPRSITVTGNASYTAIFGEVGAVYYTITTNVSPENSGTVTGGGTYEEGSTVTLTATANPGYQFNRWNDGSTQNPRTVTVTSSMSFTAIFTQNQYTITVLANPNNAGSVSGGGAFYYGDHATLTATAYNGYEFQGWSDGSIENPHQVLVTGNATYTATFSQSGSTYYTVSTHVSPAGAGSVNGAGTYPAGSTVTLTATANQGYTFDHWNDGSTQNPRTITVNNNMSFTAFFNTAQYTITVNASPAAGGTVSGGGTYAYGASATLTATPNANYEFMQWQDGSTQNPRTITVTGNATYTAIFLTDGGELYTLTVKPNYPLLGQTSGSGTYPAGAAVEISAYPSPYARFIKWNDGNTENPRTVIVNSNMEFIAEFSTTSNYVITVVSANENMGQAYGGGTFQEGTEIEISALAYEGYIFTGWQDGNTENPRTITVTSDATYTASFAENSVTTYTVTLICNTSQGSVSGGGIYVAGSTAFLQAFPNDGYEFDKWNDNSTENPRTLTVNSDITLVVFFKSTGIEEEGITPMAIYPNPAKESIRILGIDDNSSVEIYNSLGELVKTVSASPDQEIGIRDLATGLYLVRCGNRTQRFIKQQ